jgi:flagellar protein FliS
MTQNFSAVDQYARLALRTDIETASPHRIILLLLDGAQEKIRPAKLTMKNGDIAPKCANISWAISIIDGLRASLNLELGGEIAANLDRLYDYMALTLTQANLDNDVDKLSEIETLLRELRAGWKGIESEVGNSQGSTVHNDVGSMAVGLG